MEQFDNIGVFISSPDEVHTRPFRTAVHEAVDAANQLLKRGKHSASLFVSQFEDLPVDSYPEGIQSAVDSHMDVASHDILVGIFGLKFGTPDPRLAGCTPTEHEVRRALKAREKRGDRPKILLHFLKGLSPDSTAQAEQQVRVLAFRAECRELGVWTQEVTSTEEFRLQLVIELFSHAMDLLIEKRKGIGLPNLGCEVSAEILPIRAEGVSERLGDVIMSFNWNSVESTESGRLAYNLLVHAQPSINFTSSIFGEGWSSGEPAYVSPVLLYETEDGAWSNPIYGVQSANNVIHFEDVLVRRRGSGSRQRIRIVNLRANASQLGVPAGAEEKIGVAVIFEPATPDTPALPMKAFHQLAIAKPSMGFRIIRQERDTKFLVSPEFHSIFSSALEDSDLRCMAFEVVFSELEQFAFKTRLEEAGIAGRWSASRLRFAVGTVIPSSHLSTGTRLMARFARLPQGGRLFVSKTNLSGDHLAKPQATLVATDPNGAGGFLYWVPPDGWAEVSLMSACGQSVWEWTLPLSDLSTGLRSVKFGVVVAFPSSSRSLESATVNGNYAPVSTIATSSTSAPIPRFVDTATNRGFPST